VVFQFCPRSTAVAGFTSFPPWINFIAFLHVSKRACQPNAFVASAEINNHEHWIFAALPVLTSKTAPGPFLPTEPQPVVTSHWLNQWGRTSVTRCSWMRVKRRVRGQLSDWELLLFQAVSIQGGAYPEKRRWGYFEAQKQKIVVFLIENKPLHRTGLPTSGATRIRPKRPWPSPKQTW